MFMSMLFWLIMSRYHWRQRSHCLPWWWFMPYLIVIIVFFVIIGFLVAHGYPVAVAVGVPATLSTVAVYALTRVAQVARLVSRSA